jgi:Fe-S-cluster-containing dehydrogenase component/DMSO reductase anchor subunit
MVTAIDRFARAPHARTGTWRDSLAVGQQYAFEVDLDACTGCKACVTGCHTMNGLDEGELWRTVGLLHGGSALAPVQQTVTTSCHHCVEPACMIGCPAEAYEKDPRTGIVRHLADHCIGCQYCTFTCPYEAPKYNAARGIVRKCDLCAARLERSEAPACVEACPNGAIAIRAVDREAVLERHSFVAAAAPPDGTLPTTHYETRRALPPNLLPADFYSVHREDAHPSLAFMLVLMQLSVGAFALAGPRSIALGAALLGLAVSLFHLGQPQRAWRAVLGLRRSWLSREIVAFGVFAALAVLGAPRWWIVAAGAAGLGCSVMVYATTQRALWNAPLVTFKFFGTATLLGLACAGRPLLLAAAMLTKLAVEVSLLRHVGDLRHTPLKRAAILMTRDLRGTTELRFLAGVLGGCVLAWFAPWAALASCVAGELLERHLFFVASVPPRMPGGLA